MDCKYEKTYHKYGEIYLADINDYTILCLHCDESYNDIKKFNAHAKMHSSKQDTTVNEHLGSTLVDFDSTESQSVKTEYLASEIFDEGEDPLDDIQSYSGNDLVELKIELKSQFSENSNDSSFADSNHVLENCIRSQEKYVCNICFCHFAICKDLYDHHKEEQHCASNYNCPICLLFTKEEIKKRNDLGETTDEDDYVAEKDTKPKDLLCQFCNQTFKLKFNLDKHEKLHKANKLKCKYCNKIFRTPSRLNTHFLRKHTPDRPYRCKLCPAAFRVHAYLKNHIIYKHTEQRPYACDFDGCNATFKMQTLKHEHEKRHLPSKIQCEICGNDYKTKMNLRKHQMSKHVDPENWEHQCETCKKRFAQEKSLIQHRKIHSGEKPYGCDLCPRYFRKRSALNQHRKFHDDEKKNVCGICGKVFKNIIPYRNHLTRHS